MKKIIVCMLVIALALTSFCAVSAEEYASVYIDIEKVEFDVQPQIIDGRTMVPLRAIFEKLGAVVEWDDVTQTAVAVKDDKTVKTTIGSKSFFINDEEKQIDVAPMLIDERTLVPARFVAEAFDCRVYWNEKTSEVMIITGIYPYSDVQFKTFDTFAPTKDINYSYVESFGSLSWTYDLPSKEDFKAYVEYLKNDGWVYDEETNNLFNNMMNYTPEGEEPDVEMITLTKDGAVVALCGDYANNTVSVVY